MSGRFWKDLNDLKAEKEKFREAYNQAAHEVLQLKREKSSDYGQKRHQRRNKCPPAKLHKDRTTMGEPQCLV